MRRLAGRLVCRAASHPYHVTDAPPTVPGVCDIDGSELYQRDDDREDVVRNRVAVFERDTMPVREHYRALGTPVVTIDGARPPRGRRGRSRRRRARAGGRMILRKSRRELERMAAAGSVVARTLALLRERARPGVTTGELDRAAEDFIREQGGVPTFKGYHGFPASICASPNDMVVHGIPGAYALQRGRRALGRRRRHAARLGRRLGLHVLGRRGRAARGRAAPADRLPGRALRRRRAVRRRPPPLRHRARRADARRGRRLRRDPLARRPRRRPADARGSADPELRAARPRPRAAPGHDARRRADDHGQRRDRRAARRGRRLVDLQRRPLAHRALRAHRRRDRRRAADPDPPRGLVARRRRGRRPP